MPSIERLQDEREGLEEEYDLLSKKIRRLRKTHAIEVDPAVKLKLEIQIEDSQAELEKVEQQLDQLELKIDRLVEPNRSNAQEIINLDQLYNALLKLGYWDQQRTFKGILKNSSVGAFLIQGKSHEYGQRWLLNRLAREITRNTEAKVIKIDLGRIVSRNDVPALWRELAGRVGLKPQQSSIPEIVKCIYQWWQTQNVFMVFHDVECTTEENLHDLIEGFWKALATQVLEASVPRSNFKLLMFLLDYKGCVSSWNLNFVKQHDSMWQPTVPLGLPDIRLFPYEELVNWIEQQSDALPKKIFDDVEEAARIILNNTENGIPEPTLREICSLCDCNWYDHEEKWLKL